MEFEKIREGFEGFGERFVTFVGFSIGLPGPQILRTRKYRTMS